MHSQSNNSQHVHVDYNPIQGRLSLISSLMFRKSRSLEDIICQYIDGFLISTISLFSRKSSKFLLRLGVDIFNTNEKNTQTNLLSFIQNEK